MLKPITGNPIITGRRIITTAPITGATVQTGAVTPLPALLLHPEAERPTPHRAGVPAARAEEDNRTYIKNLRP